MNDRYVMHMNGAGLSGLLQHVLRLSHVLAKRLYDDNEAGGFCYLHHIPVPLRKYVFGS